jgi:phospholipid/cholesterol/gamma-HCH transport system substrate-binding protein
MKSNKINYVIVGTFVLAMLAGLIVAIALLTGRTGATDSYFTVYSNVTGVKFGTQVLYEGYPVGQVEEVTPVAEDGGMRFRVDFAITEGWRIPKDSYAQVGASGLLAAVSVNIHAGIAAAALEPGSEVSGRKAANLFADISELSENNVKPLLANISQIVDTMTEIMEEDGMVLIGELRKVTLNLSERLPRIADNIENVTERAPAIADDLESLIATLGRTAEEVRILANPKNRKKLEGFIENLRMAGDNFAGMSGDLRETRKRIDLLVETLNTMVSDNRLDVEKAVIDLRYVVDSTARHIDTLNQNLEGASRNMYEFSRQIRQNPGLLLGGTPPEDKAATR